MKSLEKSLLVVTFVCFEDQWLGQLVLGSVVPSLAWRSIKFS